jgi:hypothetical protein
MANKVLADKGGPQLWDITINDISVGLGGNNYRRADVQLVQFFLKQFYDKHPEIFYKLPRSSANRFMIDGICGGQTTSGIRYFQDYQRNGGGGQPLAVDGLVDVCNKDSPISTISRTLYTILSLNDWFQKYGDGREHNANLERHPDIIRYAPELRMELALQQMY